MRSKNAMATDKLLFVSTQKDEKVLIPTVEDDFMKSVLWSAVKQMLKIQGDVVSVLVEGICRGASG